MKRIGLVLTLLLSLATAQAQDQDLRLLVGTYTEGTPAEGVYLYSFDARTAEARLLSVAPSGNPSFVIPSPDGRVAWSVNEYNDGRQGVSTYAISDDPSRTPAVANTLTLSERILLPKGVIDGEDPCNLLCTGDALVCSNYTGGTLAAYCLGAWGRIEGLSQSFAYQEAGEPAHMHCAVLSPDRKYIFATDLGRDCILRFDCGTGIFPLSDVQVAWRHKLRKFWGWLVLGRKYGPRHMTFSADGRFAYLLCELGDKLVTFRYSDGILTPIQTLTAYKGKGHGSADIHLSPDGRFLYTSHRLRQDGIAIFSVNPKTGKVKRAGFQPTGTHPRNFAISPDGRFLLCACRDDNRIEIYGIDPDSGALTPTERSIEVGAPVCVQFF